MAATTNRVQLTGLARKLVMDGLLEEETAAEAFQEALSNKESFVKHVVENKLTDARAVAHAASEEFGVPLLDIDVMEVDQDTVKLVDQELIEKHNALPLFKRGNRVFIGVSDPTNLQALDEIKFNIGTGATEAVLVEWDKLSRTIDKA
ncbi:MAG: type IV-A pilus assembly ATPase PilB, partial [Pseudomonadota bacterium]